MIELILQMLRTRRGQAIALGLLGLLAVGAAVAVPAYMRAVDVQVVRGEVADASPAERTLTVSTLTAPGGADPAGFEALTSVLLDDVPGLAPVYSVEFATKSVEPDRSSRVIFRQGVCAHLGWVAGRCLIGSGEVVIGAETAQRLRLSTGDDLLLSEAGVTGEPKPPVTVTVVGIYTVRAPGETYWAGHNYFAPDATGRKGEPVFTGAATMERFDPQVAYLTVDAEAPPSAFDRLDDLRARLDGLQGQAAETAPGLRVQTGIPDLADRVERSRAVARQTVPIGAVPLVLLAYLTLYLAVDYGTEGRRRELAVVALRGARWWHRWLLVSGEPFAAIVAGAAAGCVAGQLAVSALVAWRLPGAGAPGLGTDTLLYAGAAAAGALLVALLAQRRHLLSPVTELLRRVRSRAGAAGVVVFVVLAVLAATTVVQLFLTDGQLAGVGLLAPALAIGALAYACSWLLAPAARAAGRAALRRGRLDLALAALQLGRRPAAQRMMLLLVASVAVLGYAVSAADVARQDRELGARIGTGAPRVVSLAPVSRHELLRAVRAADPSGEFAMAVAQLPGGGLAVDSARLAAVVDLLPEYGALERVADLLHPPAHAPVVFPSREVSLDAVVSGIDPGERVRLRLVLASLSGPDTTTLDFGLLDNGPHTFTERERMCDGGCRLAGIGLSRDGTGGAADATLTLRSLSGADLFDATRWRVSGASVTASGDGLRLSVAGLVDSPAWLQPADAPYPLPAVSAGPPGAQVDGLDERAVPVRTVGTFAALPRVGTAGTLVDLEYADRLSVDAGVARSPEVWLNAAAPPDVLDRLAAAGLWVTGERTAGSVRDRLDRQGPALSLWFHLCAGVLAVVLAAGGIGLIAAVDRADRSADRAALRIQGLPRDTVRRAALWTYPALVVASGVCGLAVSLAVWRLTGWALPVFGSTTDLPPLPSPRWPATAALPLSWLFGVALLLAVALRVGGAGSAARRQAT
ncbi:FtsX-like permease family protein [Dactylosporangium sucinum]|uniref:ABC3 transporter permease C-terminal domain-containing protein n=1 Tax=Dactylosporangium sucinum TaxID=1424081 RepID=A0A917U6Q2_9ACTN|nr:FtsX-like permease family protein [Dactylosporangium sucinum]GGM58994.1 hypothetical protein GCM10007977_070660 [Dactylosporangium sucinum]